MSKKTRKKTDTKAKDSKFLRFSKIQVRYLNEVRTRTVKELNDAVDAVCEELGIVEKIKQAPPGMYKLRLDDLSGLDVLPPPPKPKPPPVPPKSDGPQGKSGKDN